MPISKDQIFEYVYDELFQLQPEEYSEEFPQWPGTVGLECEATPVDLSSFERVHFGGELREALLRFSDANVYRKRSGFYTPERSEPARYMSPMILDAEGNNLSLEPGGQVEVSTRPFPCLIEANTALLKEQKQIAEHFRQHNIGLVFGGIDPENTVPSIDLQIAKDRYQCMNKHFEDIGEFGQRMMRQTCTVQVNLDFGRSDAVLSKRFAVAQFFSPILTAMFANSPFVDGKRSAFKSFRGRIWLDADKSRCGFVGGSVGTWFGMDRKAWAKAYAEKICQSSVVMLQKDGAWVRPAKPSSFGEWANDGSENGPTRDSLDLQATLLFPEVRAKGFMELRSIDAQLQKWQAVPGTILSGALYNEASLNELFELAEENQNNWSEVLASYLQGLESPVVSRLAKQLFQIGLTGVQGLPECFYSKESLDSAQQFYQSFTERNLCPADQLIGIASEKGGPLSLKDLYELGLES